MIRSRPLLLTVVAAVVAALLGVTPAAAQNGVAQDGRPGAVVALGDSAASGEGAGDYVPGTRGENGDWCHRSPHAYVTGTGLAPEAVNLACSGARSADVAFGPGGRYGEPSQAQQLAALARRYRVTTVVLQVGANDDAALTATGIACISSLIDFAVAPCSTTLGPLVAGRMAATATKVEAAARDVQAAMRDAGYRPGSWTFVLTSYASPITEKMLSFPAARGCPYARDDAKWGRTVLFPALSTALAGVAQRVGARFLDLHRATEGYEACTRTPSSQEWQRRLTVDPAALVHGGLDAVGFHLAQESFHPDATGHAEIGRCLGEFVRNGADSGACVPGSDGHDHLTDAGSYSTTRS